MDDRFLGHLTERKGHPIAIATIVSTEGSTLGKPGFKILVDAEGQIVHGTLGGGCPEGPIAQIAQEVIATGRPRLVRVHLEDVGSALRGMTRSEDEIHVETNCGGTLSIFVERYAPRPEALIFGDSHRGPIEEALVRLLQIEGFRVRVHNVVGACPLADQVDTSDDPSTVPVGPEDYVVVATRGSRDSRILAHVLEARPRYVGLIASRHRAQETFRELREQGLPEESWRSVHTPAGISIGAITPEEIALSVAAEIVAVRRGSDPARGTPAGKGPGRGPAPSTGS